MLWKFSFASGSTLDTLLSRETPPSIEELLDDQDILSECKGQNAKLVTYLSREDNISSLLHWVTSGLDDLDQEAAKAEDKAYEEAIASKDIYPPFKAQGEEAAKETAGDKEGTAQDEESPIAPGLGIGLGEGFTPIEETSTETNRSNYPRVAAEILTSELWTIPETIMAHKETLLKSFWDAVIPPLDGKDVDSALKHEKERAHLAFWTDEDEERERKREVIRGLWMRVNAALLQKRATEMVRFIQSMPDILERMMARIESPAIQDMLARIIQTEEAGVSDVLSWLRDQRLVPHLLELLSPKYPPSTHQIVADLLKGIISVSAPNSSFNPQGGNAMAQEGGLQGSTTRDNRLVRELTNRESIQTLVGYIIDAVPVADANWKGLDNDGPGTHRSDPFVVHPLPSVASVTSSLCYVCNVIVEIIRRNNSDLAEPYLFNTMRNLLMGIQSEHMAQQQDLAPDETPTDSDESDDATREKMESALPELADKLAIVHLGNLVTALTERFPQLHQLLVEPRSAERVKSEQNSRPLTMERFRVIELYAELLHSSNMSTLNRVPGTGPEYSPDGALLGGLDGLDRLGHALQANESGDEEQDEDVHLTQAKELPISSSSTDYSLTESDDVALSDGEESQSIQTTPTATTASTMDVTVPPPPSPADAERLRTVMGIETDCTTPSETASHAAVAATTVAPSVASDTFAEPNTQLPSPVDELSTGERLKQKFITYRVLPTLMDLFFEHSNNNFLHHLVYDILQQILNGHLEGGYNRELVVDLFQRAKLVDRVLSAQRMNDELVSSTPPKPRLSYMGHISLIAEELVKFFARCPPELFELIKPSFDVQAWEVFVNTSLRDTRARDSQPLAGGKPRAGLGSGLSTNSERSDSESDDDDDHNVGLGEPLCRTPGKQQGDSFHDAGADDDEGGMDQFWRPSNSRSAAMDSSDDDDDADWLNPSGSRRGEDDDEFGAFHSTSGGDDDDAWGSFTSVNASDSTENPFGDDAFAPSSGSTATTFHTSEPLTPLDWAEAFDREFDAQPSWAQDAEEEEVPSIVVPENDGNDSDIATPTSGWSFPGDESDEPGEDLPPAAAGAKKPERPPTAGSDVNEVEAHVAALQISTRDLRDDGADDPRDLEEKEEAATASAAHPLGPGTAPGTAIVGGMVERTMEDGTVVRVPEDDIARGIDEAMERRVDAVDDTGVGGGELARRASLEDAV